LTPAAELEKLPEDKHSNRDKVTTVNRKEESELRWLGMQS